MENKELIILIGAARSGTKAFRGLFNTHPNISTIPYDINYIWQIGNENSKHDLFLQDSINEKAKNRIKNYIKKYYKNNNILVEKTVSNTIRIPFLLSIFPKAKFVLLYRNGIDVVESVHRQWDLKLDKSYLKDKIKHVPLEQLFSYGIKYLKRNITRSKEEYFWGVKTPNLMSDLKNKSRFEAIALQWKFCVDRMLEDKNRIKPENRIDVFYEDFVTRPNETIKTIADKFNLNIDSLHFDSSIIKSNNVGKSKQNLNSKDLETINSVIEDTQDKINQLKKIHK